MSRKVLLTGATGFVGRQVLRCLIAAGCSVRAIVREGAALESTIGIERVETRDLFAEDASWFAQACDGIDTVTHVAWFAKPGLYLDAPENLACLQGTLALAQGAAQAKVRRFVGVGTCFEYDLSEGLLSVETKLMPTTVYAGAKAAAFMALSNWLPSQRVGFAWCRLFYLFGEAEADGRLIPYLRQRLAAGEAAELTSGEQIRDFLDVREAGRMIADVSLGEEEGANNICSGVPMTVRQLAEKVADEYKRRDLLKFGARPNNAVDPPRVLGIR